MRSAFTLVEVLVAVVIATIVGAGLLQLNSNYSNLFGQIQKKSSSSEVMSIFGLHADLKYNRTDKTLYDLLEDDYEIENDDLRKYLKDQKFAYTEHLVDTITLGEEELGGEFGDYSMDEGSETSALAPVIQFEILDIVFKNKEMQGAILHVRPVEL